MPPPCRTPSHGPRKACTRRAAPAASGGDGPEQDLALHGRDRLGDADLPRAGFRAVEDLATPPDARPLVQDGEALGRALVTGVEDEAVRVHDGRRADVL